MRPQNLPKTPAPCRATAKPKPISPALRAACERRVKIYRGLMRAGFTCYEASHLVGHVLSTFWKWERGKIAVSPQSVPRIMRRFYFLRRRVERLERVLARLGVSP